MNLESKIEKVKDILENKKVCVAFSGGADSSLIAYLARAVCSEVLAVTIDNNILPPNFIEDTKDFCKKYDIKQEIIFEDFYKHKDIISNNHDRCFLCRNEMYKHITATARENDIHIIVDGTNISDLIEDRPGILINYKNNIKSPFVEANLSSKEIHEYLNKNNIPYSHSTTCLATRLPFGCELTDDKYERISKAEEIIYENSNVKIAKVRQDKTNAIVEVDNIDELIKDNRLSLINEQLKALGYGKVTLNLEPINDDKEIRIKYENNQFEYQLPYEIDIEKTDIKSKNIKIEKTGLVKGSGFDNYKEVEEEFMNILPKIRRKI